MAQEKTRETVNQLVEQGKSLVEKGNQRHIVIRDAAGKKLIDVSFTVAVVVAAALFFMQPFSWFVAIGALIYGVATKIKIEVVRNLSDEDTVIEMQIPQDEV
jgi:hypothetical protein